MNSRLQVSFRGIDRSPYLEDDIRGHCEHLERLYGPLTSCHVTVELPHRHQNKGNIYTVRIHAKLKSLEVVVGHDPALDHAHEDAYIAVRDAFHQAQRQLESKSSKHRREREPEPV